jgi:uncharacterized protein (UPF0548 family)
MFLVSRPDAAELGHWLAGARAEPLPEPFAGWELRDHRRVVLGHGAAVFERAREALAAWTMFHLGWIEIVPARPPIEIGTTVGVLARTFGLWSLNACRIVAVIDDEGAVARYGFVYRTLPGHVAHGEERFMVEWERQDDAVTYDVLARSRPGQPLLWLGFPVMRLIQRRFRRESARAMARAVAGGATA